MYRRISIAAIVLTVAVLCGDRALAGYAAVVVDADTGQTLHEVNANTPSYPASLTKMMTLYLVFEALEAKQLGLGQKLRVSEYAAGQAPSKLGLKPGETITVEEAIAALVTKSANDVAVVVAEGMSGSEMRFARRMTHKAQALGMRRTTFRNASGLPDRRQQSTAIDMARLASALMRDFPHHYANFSRKSFTFRGVTHANHNRLLNSYDGADGIKTGFIRDSGFNVVISAERDGRRLIGVVFGGQSAAARDQRMAQLLDQGFVQLHQIAQNGAASPRRGGGLISSAEAATPAPRKKQPSPQGDNWGVQIGAYQQFPAAQQAVARAAAKVPNLTGKQVSIVKRQDRNGVVYRARLIGMSQVAASQSCRELKTKHLDCAVIKTGSAS